MHSILYKHSTVVKIDSHLISHNLSIAQEKARVDWSKKNAQNTIADLKLIYDSKRGDDVDSLIWILK